MPTQAAVMLWSSGAAVRLPAQSGTTTTDASATSSSTSAPTTSTTAATTTSTTSAATTTTASSSKSTTTSTTTSTTSTTSSSSDSNSGTIWAVVIVVVLVAAIVALVVAMSRRRKSGQSSRLAWEQRRDAVLEEASDAHDRITGLLGRWPFLSAIEAEQLWTSEDVRLGRVRDHLRSVVMTAPEPGDVVAIQVVLDAIEDVRVALATAVQAKARPETATLESAALADASATLLQALRQAQRPVRV